MTAVTRRRRHRHCSFLLLLTSTATLVALLCARPSLADAVVAPSSGAAALRRPDRPTGGLNRRLDKDEGGGDGKGSGDAPKSSDNDDGSGSSGGGKEGGDGGDDEAATTKKKHKKDKKHEKQTATKGGTNDGIERGSEGGGDEDGVVSAGDKEGSTTGEKGGTGSPGDGQPGDGAGGPVPIPAAPGGDGNEGYGGDGGDTSSSGSGGGDGEEEGKSAAPTGGGGDGTDAPSAPTTPHTVAECETAVTCAECHALALSRLELSNREKACDWTELGKGGDDGGDGGEDVAIFRCRTVNAIESQAYKCGTDGIKYSIGTGWDVVGGDDYEDGEGSGGSSVPGMIVLIGFFGALFYVRSKLLGQRGGEGGSSRERSGVGVSGIDDVASLISGVGAAGGTRSSMVGGANRNFQETVPLSSAADEEWGWEDGSDSGEVEMSAPAPSSGSRGGSKSHRSDTDDEDLQMAIAMSLSEGGGSGGSSQLPKPQRPKPKPKRTSSNGGASVSSRTLVSSERRASPRNETSQSSVSGNSIEELLGKMERVSNAPVISSLSKQKNAPPPSRKKEEKKQADDDIFASMGLSSYSGATKTKSSQGASSIAGGVSRTKAASPSPPSSGGWRNTLAATSATTYSASQPTTKAEQSHLPDALEDLGDDEGSNWDDDSDLDDLLDD